MRQIAFTLATGDNYCPAGMRLATIQEAAVFNTEACSALSSNQWYIARLANKGSIGGKGYNCAVHADDTNPLGNSLCIAK
jgi:hypothetical protein